VPFPAGGPADAIGRILAEGMRPFLGQPVIVENVSGAAGSIGVGRVAHAAADGYTLSVGPGWATHVLNGAIYPLKYDVVGDFEPVALLSDTPQLIVARKSMPADDLKQLIAWLRANPEGATQATSGVGSAGHVIGIFLQKETGTRFQFVPYRGLAPAMQDLLAGRVDLMIDLPANSLAHVRAGTIKPYAVTTKMRLDIAPDIPTVDEAGLPGFYASAWYSVFAPKGTPKEVVARLNAAIVSALADTAVRRRLADLGQQIVPRDRQTPEALGALQKAEIAKWRPVIKAAGIRPE